MTESSIETGVYATMHGALRQVVDGAGLALMRGPVGIGKTYAIEAIIPELEAEGVKVVYTTATEVTGGSNSAFSRAVLSQYRIDAGSTWEAMEELWKLLRSFPFLNYGGSLLIVDEAQFLKPSLLETIRCLWDRGDHARRIMGGQPAFGCALIGNDTFMSKGGTQRIAGFEALKSRVTHDIKLPRPSRAEHEAFATYLFPSSIELQREVAEFGRVKGNLRAQDVAARQALVNARGGEVTLAHLKVAMKFMGGL